MAKEIEKAFRELDNMNTESAENKKSALEKLIDLINLKDAPGQTDKVGVSGNIEARVYDKDGNEKDYKKVEF